MSPLQQFFIVEDVENYAKYAEKITDLDNQLSKMTHFLVVSLRKIIVALTEVEIVF
jgi:hypothetical protein